MASAVEQPDVGGETEVDEKSLNQIFDEAFELFRTVNDFEGETTSQQFQFPSLDLFTGEVISCMNYKFPPSRVLNVLFQMV
ncbi:unnamed protein product [Allacma fusca]|uniref:Uncharacterized protein n=1 Tax=Allacma fusca TaxID=39272 RepID=A0A8J2KC33_9HEXA|nr:unnamed protein product [Allacma fusca]